MKSITSQLESIPSIGKTIAQKLRAIGINTTSDLKDKDPELLYHLSNQQAGVIQDPCLLYTFRCAVYVAQTPASERDPELLKRRNWKQ